MGDGVRQRRNERQVAASSRRCSDVYDRAANFLGFLDGVPDERIICLPPFRISRGLLSIIGEGCTSPSTCMHKDRASQGEKSHCHCRLLIGTG
jgi:hypothetical protein